MGGCDVLVGGCGKYHHISMNFRFKFNDIANFTSTVDCLAYITTGITKGRVYVSINIGILTLDTS